MAHRGEGRPQSSEVDGAGPRLVASLPGPVDARIETTEPVEPTR